MKNKLEELPTPEKKVVAKTLILNGYSSRKVEDILAIDHNTALRYAEEETPEDLRQFETIFKNRLEDQKKIGIDLVHKRLIELIPRERRIESIVKAGEFLDGRNIQGNTNIQINNVIPILGGKAKDAIQENISDEQDIESA